MSIWGGPGMESGVRSGGSLKRHSGRFGETGRRTLKTPFFRGDTRNKKMRGTDPFYLHKARLREGLELFMRGHARLRAGFEKELTAAGLGYTHYRVLSALLPEEGLTLKALRLELDITKQALSKTLGRLSQLGCIEASVEPGDRRARALHLTEAGRHLEARLTAALLRPLGQAWRAAGPEAALGFCLVLENLGRMSLGAGAPRRPGKPKKQETPETREPKGWEPKEHNKQAIDSNQEEEPHQDSRHRPPSGGLRKERRPPTAGSAWSSRFVPSEKKVSRMTNRMTNPGREPLQRTEAIL